MPTLPCRVEVDLGDGDTRYQNADVEFEVYCSVCNSGNCHTVDQTRTSRQRGMPQIVLEPCPKCLTRERADGEDSRDFEVSELEDEVRRLADELEALANEPCYTEPPDDWMSLEEARLELLWGIGGEAHF